MSANKRYLIVVGIVFVGLFIASPIIITFTRLSGIKLTNLTNAGVLIQSKDLRIYIDPFYSSTGYEEPADILCITHPHTDHYIPSTISQLQNEGTINIFPEVMVEAIATFDGIGLSPEEKVEINDRISLTAFYLYSYEPLHPLEANWTSFIIDIDGFVFFISGDSALIPEYEQLTGLIDVAILNYVPNLLMNTTEIVDAINIIEPRYVMLNHSPDPQEYTEFYNEFGSFFNAIFLNLGADESYRF